MGAVKEPWGGTGPVKRARLVDVARAAGVSTATASLVLSGHRSGRSTPASPETVARIRAAAKELGYVPNRFAQAMRRGYTSTVVLALGAPSDPWAAELGIQVRKRALAQGFSTLGLIDETWYQFLLGYRPGVAFITSTDFEEQGLERVAHLAEHGVNLVVYSTVAEPRKFDVISSSPVAATADAYRRLRSRHEQVHFLSALPPDDARPGPTRLRGFREATREFGDDPAPLIHLGGIWDDEVSRACRTLLERRPEAVICAHGQMARVLRVIARSMGRRLPEDLEIISIGDIPHNGSAHDGPITVYGTPRVFDRLGDIIVNRAVRQQVPPFERHVFDWEFMPGVTTVDPT